MIEIEKFENKFMPEPMSGCWLWLGCEQGNNGYGGFFSNGKRTIAHRYSYQVYVGAIPEGLSVLHRCDVPACVNPKHLFLGTHPENMHDMAKKGRANSIKGIEACRLIDKRGERHPSVKMTDEMVISMRAMKRKGLTYKSLSVIFKIDSRTIASAVLGHTWGHLPDAVEPKWTRKGK